MAGSSATSLLTTGRPIADDPAGGSLLDRTMTTGSCHNLVEVLRTRAVERPDALAFIFLDDGETAERRVTYAELERTARRIAVALGQVGPPGNRALLLYAPSSDYVFAYFGCLFAGWIPVPAYPPDPTRLARTLPRLQGIMLDAAPGVALTTREIEVVAGPILSEATLYFGMGSADMPLIATDALPEGIEEHWREPPIDGDTVALIQYTSGSVDVPKGVMVTHGNLLHNLSLIHQGNQPPDDEVIVSWLPPYHDMGLIGGILYSIWTGHLVILMSPLHFLMRPVRWLRAISKYRATTSVGPNFAYALCVRKVEETDKQTLDLSSWRTSFHGAEPIRADTLDAFVDAFAVCGFRRETFVPCYGLAESTLIVSCARLDDRPRIRWLSRADLAAGRAVDLPPDAPDAARVVSCGTAFPGGEIAIVDPNERVRREERVLGEIWVRSPSVAQGYWNRSDASRETFGGRMADGSGPYLRTGDLGLMIDGELYVIDRLKDMIIVQARNLYPHEIEAVVERAHVSVRRGCVAAFSIDVDGEERLVVVTEVERRHQADRRRPPSQPPGMERRRTDRRSGPPPGEDGVAPQPFDPGAVIGAIREMISRRFECTASVVLIRAGSIFKTPSGKIQRRLCKQALLDGTLEVVAEMRAHTSTFRIPPVS